MRSLRGVLRPLGRTLRGPGRLAAAALVLASMALAGPHDPYLPEPPLGISFPAHLVPADNPITPAKVALGGQLFFDARLSRDGSVSCASCHKPAFGWADPRPVSVGFDGLSGDRNAPSVLNRALAPRQFRDGRAASLEEQALGPIANPVEMNLSPEEAADRLNEDPEVRAQFEAIFGGPATPDRLGKVLATFERTLLTGGAPIDHRKPGGGVSLTPAADRGLRVFLRNGCQRCHRGSTLSDEQYHNLGVGMDAPKPDLGRFAVTGAPGDQGAFRTPTLRNVANTAPYMHDGTLESLEAVVEFYSEGGRPNPWLSPRIQPLELSEREKADLVVFLREALTGDQPAPRVVP